MPSIEEIILDKVQRLNEIPEQYFTGVEKFQRHVYDELIGMLGDLDRSGGVITRSQKNYDIAEGIKEDLKKVLNGKEYLQSVIQFTDQFDKQKAITDDFYSKMFSDFETSKITDLVFEQSKTNAVKLLESATPKTEFLQSISEQIDNSIAVGASWQDTVRTIRTLAIGNDIGQNDRYLTLEPKDGKLLRYAKQIASDTFAVTDRTYTKAVADNLQAEWFLYFGDELPTSREFCKQRHGKFFHRKEVEAWADLDWAGKMKDSTNKQTIFVTCGGWRCQHSLLPVTIDQVPKEDIMRNVDNGNYVLTDFDKKELGLGGSEPTAPVEPPPTDTPPVASGGSDAPIDMSVLMQGLKKTEAPASSATAVDNSVYKITNVKEAKVALKDIGEKAGLNISKIEFSSELATDANLESKINQINSLFSEYNYTKMTDKASSSVVVKLNSSGSNFGQVGSKGKFNVDGTMNLQLDKINFGHRTDARRATDFSVKKAKSNVDPESLHLATITHEFAHVMGVSDFAKYAGRLKLNTDIKSFYDELRDLRKDYYNELVSLRRRVQEGYSALSDAEKITANADFEKDYEKIFLGSHADTNVDEFFAEGFAEYKLRKEPSKYALKIGKLADKYFKIKK